MANGYYSDIDEQLSDPNLPELERKRLLAERLKPVDPSIQLQQMEEDKKQALPAEKIVDLETSPLSRFRSLVDPQTTDPEVSSIDPSMFIGRSGTKVSEEPIIEQMPKILPKEISKKSKIETLAPMPERSIVNRLLSEDTDTDLKAAQGQRDVRQLIANLAEAGAGAGAAISRSGIKVDSDFFKRLTDQASQPIEDIKTKSAQETVKANLRAVLGEQHRKEDARDASSEYSKAATAALNLAFPETAKLGPLSADTVDHVHKTLEAKAKMDMLAVAKSQAREKEDDKLVRKITDKYDPKVARGNTVIGKAAEAKRISEAALGMFDQYSDLNKVPPQILAEAVRALDRGVSGAASTIAGYEKIKPNESPASWLAKMRSVISNSPVAAKQGGWVRLYEDSLKNQIQNADRTIQTTQLRAISSLPEAQKQTAATILGIPEEVQGATPAVIALSEKYRLPVEDAMLVSTNPDAVSALKAGKNPALVLKALKATQGK